MRVALVYLGRRGGGAPYSLELAKALAPHVTLKAFVASNVENISHWQDAAIDVSPMPALETTSATGVLRETASLGRWLRIRRELTRFRPDIIHATMVHPWLPLVMGARASRSRLIFTVHDPTPHLGEATRPLIWLNQLCLAMADRRIALTDAVRQSLVAQGIAPGTIDVVPHGEFSYYQKMGRPSRKEDAPVVLFFGRILDYKGLDCLLKAFPMVHRALPQARLVVAGEGDLSPYAVLMAQCPNLEVHNRWIPEHEVSSLFARSTVVVLPYVEASQSGIIAIAAAMGIPVLASEVGGLGEQVRTSRAGILVPPRDPVALANALIRLLPDGPLRMAISRKASAVSAGDLSWNRVAQAQLESYRRALVGR